METVAPSHYPAPVPVRGASLIVIPPGAGPEGGGEDGDGALCP
jgi:hypothetical protein